MLRIVTLGDSITRGTRPGVEESENFSSLLEAGLRADGLDVEVTNCGIGGETTTGALKRLDDIITLHPDYVIVMYGINDSIIEPGGEKSALTREKFGANLTEIVHRLRAAGILPVLWTSSPMAPFGITKDYYADFPPYSTHEDINFLLVSFIAELKRVGEVEGVPVLDVNSAFLAKGEAEGSLEGYLTDGMHPNPAGHRIIADMLIAFFQQQRAKDTCCSVTRIVTMGDSVTLGVREGVSEEETYSAVLEAELRCRGIAVEVIRRGVGSETTAGGLARLDEIIALRPDFVTIMYGLNDAYLDRQDDEEPRVSVSQFGENLNSLIRRLRTASIQPILLTPNPQSPFGSDTVADALRPPYSTHGDYNFMLEYHVAEAKRVGEAVGVPVLDIYGRLISLGIHEDAETRWLTDGVHPNPACHRVIAGVLVDYFYVRFQTV